MLIQTGNIVRCINDRLETFGQVGIVHNVYNDLCSVAFGKTESLLKNEDLKKIADGQQ